MNVLPYSISAIDYASFDGAVQTKSDEPKG